MGTIFTTPRHTSASGVERIHDLNNTNNNINIFRSNTNYENMTINEEIPPKYSDISRINNTNNINGRDLRDYLVLDNGLPPY